MSTSTPSPTSDAPTGTDGPPGEPPVTRRRRRDGGADGRAGRNLIHAIGVGLLLAGLILGTLFTRKDSFLIVLVAAIVLGVWEMCHALAHRGFEVPLVPVVIGAAGMIIGAYARGAEALVVAFGLTMLAILLWRVGDGIAGAVRDIGGGVLVALYPCFLGGFAAMMLAPDDGRERIVTFVLVTTCSDIGGYIFGVLFGRHPMAPRVSPKKSWEGFAGSVLFSAVAGALSVDLMLDGSWIGGAVLGGFVALCATVGDLIESSIKRDLGIKDMSQLLPGHGGLMDRLDSLILTAPVMWAALLYLVPLP